LKKDTKTVIGLIRKQWFIFAITAAFACVIIDTSGTLSQLGILLKEHHGPRATMWIIFFISGMMLDMGQVEKGMKDIKATLAALVMIFIFAPVLALLISLIPMETGILIGLFLTAVMPTTLSSGIVMTGTAGGNMAHALFITVLANFLCIVTIPVTLSVLLAPMGAAVSITLDRQAIMTTLVVLVLLPLILGMVVGRQTGISTEKKASLQLINQWLIVGVVFIAASGARVVFVKNTGAVMAIIPMIIGFHALLLGGSFLISKLFSIGRGRRESVIFMGSQKTLALSVILQVSLFPQYGTALLVCVLHHVFHLIMDGYLSIRLGDQSCPSESTQFLKYHKDG
jgi:sodium/bile acid cotransporter 7